MLLNILTGEGELLEKILYLLISVIALLPALTFHEWAHGYAAYKLGDNTAKADGRLSLNPLDHLDPIGSLMMLLVGFGWAKPVPVITRNFRKPRRDLALVSLAGPLTNIILSFIWTMLYVSMAYVCFYNDIQGTTVDVILTVFQYSAFMNLGLGLFNLIPFPPLDGSNILMCILPHRLAAKYSRLRYYTRYVILGLIIASYLPYPFGLIYDYAFLPLTWARDALSDLFFDIAETVMGWIF